MTDRSSQPLSRSLDPALERWLDAIADGLDTGAEPPASVLPALARAGVAHLGVPRAEGGADGDITDAVAAVAAVSERSLAAGFVLWSHRTYIEYLLQSPNAGLRDRLLPALLSGELAGATALSNAMKFLSGLEELQVTARSRAPGFILDGKLPWVTNLRVEGFHVAVATARADGSGSMIVTLSGDDEGVERSADLDLMGMRSTSTAAVRISGARIDADRVLADDAVSWLGQVRPAFLGLQCGMSIGLARRSLVKVAETAGAGRDVLGEPAAMLSSALDEEARRLDRGLRDGTFRSNPAALFRIRIALAEIVGEAVSLELQASGGRAYLTGPGRDFARRWREAAFIPLITPSLVQLKSALLQQRSAA